MPTPGNLNSKIITVPPKKIEKLENLNADYYYKHNSSGGISNEEIILDIRTLKYYINKLVDKVNGEDNEESKNTRQRI